MYGSDIGATGTAFGVGSAAEIENLNKALTAGYGLSGDQTDGGIGSPLRVESLEATLKVITYSERHIVFWKDIPKLPAFNTTEEFNQLSSYGNAGGYFVPEATAPEESDSTYTRRNVQVKYIGSLRKVSHQMTLVRPAHGDVIALETMNGTRDMLRRVEEALFKGDSACVTQEWDGIEKQFTDGIGATDDDDNILDMRGEALGDTNMGEAARIIIDNYGFPTALYCGYETMTDLNNLYLPKERLGMNQPNPGTAGFALQSFATAGGIYGFRPSVFLKPGETAPSASSGSASSIPSTSGVTLAATVQTSQPTSKHPAAAVYSYNIVLENRFGKTAAISTPTGAGSITATIAAADSHVTITVSGLTSTTATAIRVYRTTGIAGTGAMKFMKRVPLVAGATQAIIDGDDDIPGTSKAYLMQVDLDVMSFKQLAPFTKIPLATIDPSIRWMQLLYGTPQLAAPRKMVLLKNIGRYVPE